MAPKKKADHIREYQNGLRAVRNVNKNPKNVVNEERKRVSTKLKNLGFHNVLTNKSQDDLVNVYIVGIRLTGKTQNMAQKLWRHTFIGDRLTNLREIIRKDKTIKKDQDVTLAELSWLVRKFLVAKIKEMKQAEVKAANKVIVNQRAARNKRLKEMEAEEKQKRDAARVRRNKAAQNRIALLNNNVRKALNNGEIKIKQLVKALANIKRKDKQEYKKLNGLNPKLSAFFIKKRNEGLTNKEQQDYDKLQKQKDGIMNTLEKQVENMKPKERELRKLKNQKANILKNAKNAQKKIKGIAKGAIQKAIAANKAREAAAKKKAAETKKKNAAETKRKAAETKFFVNLDAKAAANMKQQSNADIGIKKLDDEIVAMTDESKVAKNAVKKKLRELQKLQMKLRKKHGWNYYTILVSSNTEESKLIVETLKDLNKQWDQLKKDIQLLDERIRKAKKDRVDLRKKRKISPTKMFYLNQIGDLLDDVGLYTPKIMLKLNNYVRDALKDYYLQLRQLVESTYLKIPEFKNRAKNLMNKNSFFSALQLSTHSFTKTHENLERIFASALSEEAKYSALKDTTYDLSRNGDVKKIMELKIPPYWKGRILLKSAFYTPFVSLDDIKLITPNVLNSFQRTKNMVEEHRKRLVQKNKVNKAIATLKPAIMEFKTKLNKKKIDKGIGNLIPNAKLNQFVNNINKTITKKVKDVAKLRTNVSKLSKSKSSKKLTLMQKEITRRNKEIQTLVKDMNRITKLKTNKTKRRAAGTKITKRALGFLTRKGVENSAKKKKVIDRFLGKLAQNTRPTLKQKYRLFTDLMKPDSELNYLSQVGNGQLLQDALTKRKMVCHLYGKSPRFIRTYIPGLRQSLYTLALQYFEQHDELNNANDRKNFHNKFLNRLHGASAFPCLEGSITALTTTVIDPGLNWRGHYGIERTEMVNDVNKNGNPIQRKVVIKTPINFNKAKDIEALRNIVFGTKLGAYYGTLIRAEKRFYRTLTPVQQLQYMWTKFRDLELSHGMYLEAIGEINGTDGTRVRRAFVDSFKLYGNDIINDNGRIYTNAELNNMNRAFGNLKVTDLELNAVNP